MKLFILIIVVLALIHNISAAYNINSAECIGGYEDPNASGTCTECPEGKVSGDSYWKKSYYQDSNSCIEVPYTCGPGQVLTAYSGGYYYCGNAPKYSYCPNGKCLYDCRFGYCTGQNYCPSQYSSPASNSSKINNAQPLSNNNKISPSNSYTSTETYDPYISGTYTSTDGAVMCTTSDTAYCSPGSGFFYSGVIDMTGSTLFTPTAGCYNCTAGTFQPGVFGDNGAGKTCTKCPTNTFSGPRASSCGSTCPAGYGFVSAYSGAALNEMKACVACEAGYYNDGTSIPCKQCPVGKASIAGASSCVAVEQSCNPGQYLTIYSDRSVCYDAPINYYCYNGRCLYDCSTQSSASTSTYNMYGSACKGSTGNICDSSYRTNGPRSSKAGAMACTSSDPNHVSVPSDCPAGSAKPTSSFSYGCYPCQAGQYRGKTDDISTCSFCSNELVSGMGSDACSNVCPAGKGIAKRGAVSCTKCPSGYYNPEDKSIVGNVDSTGISKLCLTCDTLQFGDEFGTSCTECPYPKQSVIDDKDNLFYHKIYPCSVINFRTYAQAVTAVEVVMVVLFFGCLYFVRSIPEGKERSQLNILHAFGLCLYIAIPALDTLTDIAYVMTSNFYNYAIFALVLALVIVPNFYFLKHLWVVGARLRLFIPMPKFIILQKYDTLFKILFTTILSIPWLILNSWFIIPWLIFGFFLHSTKVFSIGGVSNMWLQVWTGTDKYNVTHVIDVEVLNESIYFEILVETMPQLILQLSNNILLKQPWTGVQIFSVLLSGLNALNVLYKLIYYKCYKKMDLAEIPVEVKVLGVEIIKLDPPERKHIAIHEMHHLHHHKTNEVLERLLEVVDNSQIIHDNIKTLKEDVFEVQSHLRLTKSARHFIDVVDDRIHTVMGDINDDVTILDDTLTKIENEVETLREDLIHVKKTGDWSEKYKKMHNDRLSIHREYTGIEHIDIEDGDADPAADNKLPSDSEKSFIDNFQDKHQDKHHDKGHDTK